MPKLTIDNLEVTVPEGTNVLEAARELDIIIPHFCYHEALGAVGSCRLCAMTFIDGPVKGLKMACMIEAQDGMVVSSTDPDAVEMREHPLQIVGFSGSSVHVYDEEEIHFPGDVANCTTCHTEDSYKLPLADGVLGTTVDTGADHESPVDDTVITPITAVCSSCHDSTEATGHMTLQGGSFDTTQEAIDTGKVVETCNVCHGEDREFDVEKVHNVHPKPL